MSEEEAMSSRESSIQTLEETHSFPCPYQFKVIGDNTETFVTDVVETGTDVVGEEADPEISTRESSDGTYISVTMEVEVEGAETILDVYEKVRELDEFKFVL